MAIAEPPALVTLTDWDAGVQFSVMVPNGRKSPWVLSVTVGILPARADMVMDISRPAVSPAGTGASQLGLTLSEKLSWEPMILNGAI
ncbi:MAG: hypothetical protein Q7R39_07680, partial [Dehalococcoidia bacterium]|nr:hypothetical protein [Dehalococcoidia bacterium]